MKYTTVLLFILFLVLLSPGATKARDYWQQKVNTAIQVTLNDQEHALKGFCTIDYTNNSPDTLHYVYIHLWPNAYKNAKTAFARQQLRNKNTRFYFSGKEDKGYIDSLDFSIDGVQHQYSSADTTPDIARIELKKPLLPGQSMKVKTPFKVKIPTVFSRLGHTGQAYFISQWFPKPAVYDTKGWHPMPYLDLGEFYSEYGSYDVSITLPRNYVVMATGNCVTPDEQAFLDSLSEAVLPADTLYKKSGPASDTVMKTIRFTEDNVHDFAWFADKRWVVQKQVINVPREEPAADSLSVAAYVAFLPRDQKYWNKKGAEYLKATLQYYGQYVGPYPYKTIKAVEGDMFAGGGMEYPTVTIIDRNASSSLKDVLVHEAGHNWFYGILGSNERAHAWMDEGLNSFYEQRTTAFLEQSIKDSSRKMRIGSNASQLMYYYSVSENKDQPIEQSSEQFTSLNYGLDIYYKTALLLEWLSDYMGAGNFNNAMHAYYQRWKFKHPQPEDFFAVMQEFSSRDISWFKQALQTERAIDYKIQAVRNNTVHIKNKSDFAAPAGIDILRDTMRLASIWSDAFAGESHLQIPDSLGGKWTSIRVAESVPDLNLNNNTYRKSGLFKTGGLKLKPVFSLNRAYKQHLNIAPSLAYNYYDGFSLGLLFHNLSIPTKKLTYAITPLYAFGSNTVNGAGSIGYALFPQSSVIERLQVQVDGKTFNMGKSELNVPEPLFTRFYKVAPSLTLHFKEKDKRSAVSKTLSLKAYAIGEQNFYYTKLNDSTYQANVNTTFNKANYLSLKYRQQDDRIIQPYGFSAMAELGRDFLKLSAEGNLKINYPMPKKYFYIRAFAGKFMYTGANQNVQGRYFFNSTFTGYNDYLYDDTYLMRNQQNSKQISMREGSFKIPTLYQTPVIGISDNFIATLNLKSDLPFGKLPLRIFADLGYVASSKNTFYNAFQYDLGVQIHALNEAVVLYIPLAMSRDYTDYVKSAYGNKHFFKRISFSIQLHNFNWLYLPKKVLGAVM